MSVIKKPISEHEKELLKMPSLASQLPFVFKNNKQFIELTAYCNNCHHEVEDGLVRGKVMELEEHTALVDAIAVCKLCRMGTPINYRLHDDGRISGYASNGKWMTWQAKGNNGLFKRLFNLMFFRYSH